MNEFIFTPAFPKRIYRHIVFWVVVYFFSVITYFHPFFEKAGAYRWMIVEIRECFLHVVTEMAFCYIILYLLLPFLYRKKYILFILGLMGLSIGTIWVYYYEHIVIFKYIHELGGIPFMNPKITLWFTTISFLTYFPRTAALVLAIKIIKNWYLRQQENQQLMRESASAELQLLKAQIHPHFLFNTLNNIYSFALTRSPQAPELVRKLSGTLRYMIYDCNVMHVSLEKEIAMIRDYIELEKIRYGSRLSMEQTIESTTADLVTAPLIMITFVENCFKHGASQMLQNPWIKLNILATDESLQFTVSNGIPATRVNRNLNSGIGLKNVRKRLELLYPNQHELQIHHSEFSYDVKFVIPLMKRLSVPI